MKVAEMFTEAGRTGNEDGKRSRTAIFTILFMIGLSGLIMPVAAMKNPAAVYCDSMGYQFTDVIQSDGGMAGYCILPGNQRVDAWQFLEGKVAQDQSYCKKQGYGIETVNDLSYCKKFFTSSCSACILPNGTKVEMTDLMNLNVWEKICIGDKCCGPDDSNCSFDTKTPDMQWILPVVIAIMVIPAIGIAVFLHYRKKRGAQPPAKGQ
jgi:putative hemolysin